MLSIIFFNLINFCRLADQAGNYIVASGISTSTSDNPIYAVALTYSQFPSSIRVNRKIIYFSYCFIN